MMNRDLPVQYPLDRDSLLAIERRVRVRARDDDRPVGLHADVEAARLHIHPDGPILIAGTRRIPFPTTTGSRTLAPLPATTTLKHALHGASRTHGPRGDADLAAQRDAGAAREGVDGPLRRQHADAVVHVDADHEAGAERVHEEAGGRRPGAVGQARDHDARARGPRHVEARAERREDGQALRARYHGRGDLD